MRCYGYAYEEVINFVSGGADLGVGCDPCRFQRAAGLWALQEKAFQCRRRYSRWRRLHR